MLQDLIELYYYIKSTDDVCNLMNWNYADADGQHTITIDETWDLSGTEHKWRIHISAGRLPTSFRQIFLAYHEIEVRFNRNTVCCLSIPYIINEQASDILMYYISTEEITVINQIYLEMRRLVNRSKRESL